MAMAGLLNKLIVRWSDLGSENQELQSVQELRKTTSENQEVINSLEQYGRRECLEIKGLASA